MLEGSSRGSTRWVAGGLEGPSDGVKGLEISVSQVVLEEQLNPRGDQQACGKWHCPWSTLLCTLGAS